MTEEDVIELIKNRLHIDVDTSMEPSNDIDSDVLFREVTTVKLLFDGKEISSADLN